MQELLRVLAMARDRAKNIVLSFDSGIVYYGLYNGVRVGVLSQLSSTA